MNIRPIMRPLELPEREIALRRVQLTRDRLSYSSPVTLSTDPGTALPANTVTRSVPVGAVARVWPRRVRASDLRTQRSAEAWQRQAAVGS